MYELMLKLNVLWGGVTGKCRLCQHASKFQLLLYSKLDKSPEVHA